MVYHEGWRQAWCVSPSQAMPVQVCWPQITAQMAMAMMSSGAWSHKPVRRDRLEGRAVIALHGDHEQGRRGKAALPLNQPPAIVAHRWHRLVVPATRSLPDNPNPLE